MAALDMPFLFSFQRYTRAPQPPPALFIGNVLLTPSADPRMASLTMTNHLVGSFTCPLNPIFGSIREQIKYLCCLLEVQGFISLCDCFMQRLRDRAILSIHAPGKLISGPVSRAVSLPTTLCIHGKKSAFSVIKLCLTMRLSFCKDTVTLANRNSAPALARDARRVKERRY